MISESRAMAAFRCLVMLSEGKNYREIGEATGTSATTMHRRIQALEEEIGYSLTCRSQGDMRLTELTDAGSVLAEKAKVAVAAFDDAMLTLKTLRP